MKRPIFLLLGLLIAIGLVVAVILLRPDAVSDPPSGEAEGAPAMAKPSAVSPTVEEPVDLAAVFDLRDLPNCGPGDGLDSVLERMVKTDPVTFETSRGDPISVPGLDRPLVPTFERRREVADNMDIRAVSSDLDLPGRLYGLNVVGLHRSFYEESDHLSWEIRFADDPRRVRGALNQAGFRIGTIGEWVELEGGELTLSMTVEAIDGGGAALVCAQG